MKKTLKEAKGYFLDMHPLAFWILAVMIFLSTMANAASAIIVHNPAVLSCPADASGISFELFELGLGFSVIGFIIAPLVDIIVKYDLSK